VTAAMTTAETQRRRHLARQARSDALKKLKTGLKDGEEVWITVPDFDKPTVLVRCRVEPMSTNPLFNFYGGAKVICLVHGKLRAATIVDNDGRKIWGTGYHIPDKAIFGMVVEMHERS